MFWSEALSSSITVSKLKNFSFATVVLPLSDQLFVEPTRSQLLPFWPVQVVVFGWPVTVTCNLLLLIVSGLNVDRVLAGASNVRVDELEIDPPGPLASINVYGVAEPAGTFGRIT